MQPLQTQLPLVDSFTEEYLAYYGIFPVCVLDGVLRVAVSEEPSPEVIADLEEVFCATVQPEPVDPEALLDAVQRTFSQAQSVDSLVRSIEESGALGVEEPATGVFEDLANQPPVIRYVNLLIREAAEGRASDIHLEAGPGGYKVRYRIDGVLLGAPAPPAGLQSAVVSRLKLMGDLDIAERRVPQDGRIRVVVAQREIDVRVSTVPTMSGESIVLRLLDPGHGPGTLEALGMADHVLRSFEVAVRRPHGIVLATGPTGSGKTTTLYCALQLRDRLREKIITVEDPVEYQLPGITQVPVNRKAGMTFAAGLRAILRQDPDVVLVGEMRDPETASIAVQAAMTGHLVLSTVHTNDAASAVTRLVDLGVEPYLVAATLQGILAQRLVRRVCPHCGEWRTPTAPPIALFRDSEPRVRQGMGCALCQKTGFIGRVGLFEFIEVSDAVRGQIVRSPDATAVRRIAREEGGPTMGDDGKAKIREGITTPEEVMRAVDF